MMLHSAFCDHGAITNHCGELFNKGGTFFLALTFPSHVFLKNSHWAGTNSANQSSVVRAVSPSTQSSAFPHRAGATTANTPRYTDPSQGAIPNQAAPPNPHVNSLPHTQMKNNPGSTVAQHQPFKAVYNYKPQNSDELELREGDIVQVMEKCDDGWFVGTSERTRAFGTFPGNYVAPV